MTSIPESKGMKPRFTRIEGCNTALRIRVSTNSHLFGNMEHEAGCNMGYTLRVFATYAHNNP